MIHLSEFLDLKNKYYIVHIPKISEELQSLLIFDLL